MLSDNLDAVNENAIAVKLPPFGMGNPRVWFIQLEAYFRFRRITCQSTMFSYVATQLPTDIACEVIDLLDPMPKDAPYDRLKAALLRRISASEEARFQQLLSGIELGDRTPSQLLRHMKSLVGDMKLDETVLRQLWTKCLPPNTTAILSVQDAELPLEKLADVADKIHECFFKPAVAQVMEPENPDTKLLAVIRDLQAQVSELSLQVNNLREHRNQRNTARPRSPSRSHQKGAQKPGICYYHRRFGVKSTRCTLPCSHPAAFTKGSPNQGNAPARQ